MMHATFRFAVKFKATILFLAGLAIHFVAPFAPSWRHVRTCHHRSQSQAAEPEEKSWGMKPMELY
jgi:hypothetical protein